MNKKNMGFTILTLKDTCATGMLSGSCLEKLTFELYLQNVPVEQEPLSKTKSNISYS